MATVFINLGLFVVVSAVMGWLVAGLRSDGKDCEAGHGHGHGHGHH